MPTITAITPTKRDPDRVTVRIDGQVAAILNVRSIVELNLTVGCECPTSRLTELEHAAAVDKAMKQAMTRLGPRAMSCGQLERKLTELGHTPQVRQQVLDRLTQVGLLDDQAYAEALIRQIKRQKPAGPRLLRQKLREKFIPTDLIEQTLEAATDRQDDIAGAIQLAQKRSSSLQNVDSVTRNRRIYALLARRGFDPDTIQTALTHLPPPGSIPPRD